MKIVYLGSGEFGIECLNALNSSTHSVQLVVTQPPNPAGRGRKPKPTPAARWADANSIPFIETDNANTPEMIEKIADYKPDLIVVIAFGQKVGNDLINLPPKSAVNVMELSYTLTNLGAIETFGGGFERIPNRSAQVVLDLSRFCGH